MKKLLLAACAVLGFTASTFAQAAPTAKPAAPAKKWKL